MEKARDYVTAVVIALLARNVKVSESWLDPFYPDPRDATIRIGESEALVWNEEQGWLHGTFVCGRQGQRTVLADSAGLGNGVLPTADEVADLYLNGIRTAIRVYRRLSDNDNFEEALREAGEELLVNS
jgi:hypothetical protein